MFLALSRILQPTKQSAVTLTKKFNKVFDLGGKEQDK